MKKEFINKLKAILSKIDANTLEAWEDDLEETKTVAILADFDKSSDIQEKGSDITPYNGWLEELQAIIDSQVMDVKPKTLKQINEDLYGVLCDMLASRKGWDENGQIDFNQNDLDSMEQTYAYIKIRYFLESPDGDREEEEYKEFEEEGSVPLTDASAYTELSCRLNNTRIYKDED